MNHFARCKCLQRKPPLQPASPRQDAHEIFAAGHVADAPLAVNKMTTEVNAENKRFACTARLRKGLAAAASEMIGRVADINCTDLLYAAARYHRASNILRRHDNRPGKAAGIDEN